MKKYVSIFLCCALVCSFSVFAFADSDVDISTNSGDSSSKIQQEVEIKQLKISASDTTGLHSIVLNLIGSYNPIVTDHTYTQGSGYTYHEVSVTPDYSWIMSCALFIVVIFSVFRLIGLALGGIR